MNATKRKFNALLNGIGTRPTTPKDVNREGSQDTGALWDVEFAAAKRRRKDKEVAMQHSKHSMIHQNAKSIGNPPAAEAPKYAPWDRAEFLKRLKSFNRIIHWKPKPARINEVEWAKRGWVCQRDERVRCSLCNVEILVKLDKEDDGKELPIDGSLIEEALVDKYVELIVTSHNEDCLWRRRGCDDSIFKLPLNHAPTTLKNLKEIYTQLKDRKEKLPFLFNLSTPPEFDLDTILSQLPTDFFGASPTDAQTETNQPPEINKVGLVMALFGWQGNTNVGSSDQSGMVSCNACFRSLGLWLFRSKEVNEAGEEVVGAAMNCLDVVRQHRDYCPWSNAASQNGQHPNIKPSTRAKAGWEVVLRVIKNDFYVRTSNDPQRPVSQSSPDRISELSEFGEDIDDADARSIRDEKDKERWARLRRVKSLFDPKGKKKVEAKK